MIRRAVSDLPLILLLALVWCALWGEVSPANALAGLALGAVVSTIDGPHRRSRVRWAPLARLLGLVLTDLVRSTVQVAIEIVTPADRTDEAILVVDVPAGARSHLLLLVVAVTVTPGTAVVDADPDTGSLYLHVLHHDRAEEAVAHARRLAELAAAALPGESAAVGSAAEAVPS